MKLNIGAGKTTLPGFEPWDIKNGRKAYPLDVPDASCEELYASHVLEHLGHNETLPALKDWFRALVPGGRLRVAVPDFAKVVEAFVTGDQTAPIDGWLFGGQTDADDYHRTAFTTAKLATGLELAGFERIGEWQPEIRDCAALPVSLNLQGFKPRPPVPTADVAPDRVIPCDPNASAPVVPLGRMVAIWSCPRLGFMDAFDSIYRSLSAAGVKILRGMGVYWGQQIEALMDAAIAQDRADLLLCLDYDAVFTPDDLAELLRLMATHPEADAVCAHQWNRAADRPLWTVAGRSLANPVTAEELAAAGELFPVDTAHFGLTILRTKALAKVPKPWFHSLPAPDGSWGVGKTDADIRFWHQFRAAGCQAFLAPCVVIGHLELALRWPGKDLHLIWQHMYDYHAGGKPAGAFGPAGATVSRSVPPGGDLAPASFAAGGHLR